VGRAAEETQDLTTDEAWVQDAELVIIRTTQEGSVERELHVPGFPLDTPQRPPGTTQNR
jgi:hypothetical protein